MRKVPTDNSYAVGGDMLKKMVEEDKAAGLIPFYVRQRQKISSYQTITRPGHKKQTHKHP